MRHSNEVDGTLWARQHRITPRRPVKVQICLSVQERVRLSERARAGGFESISSYVRAATLGAGERGHPGARALGRATGSSQ
jgi:hypothetical protein